MPPFFLNKIKTKFFLCISKKTINFAPLAIKSTTDYYKPKF